MDTLFSLAREASDPSTWSKAVELARNATVTELSESGAAEAEYSIQAGPRDPVIYVSFVPEDEVWDCDCDGPVDPCEHVLATLISLKQGGVKKAGAHEQARESARVVHAFSRIGSTLSFSRYLSRGNVREELTSSLLQCVTEVRQKSSYRLLVTDDELKVDHALPKQKRGILDPQTMRYLLPVLSRVPHVELDGVAIRVSNHSIPVVAEVVDDGEGFRIRRKPIEDTVAIFDNSAIIIGDRLHAIEDSSLRVNEIDLLKGAGTYFNQKQTLELATHIIPTLRGKIQVEIASSRVPRARTVPPRLVYDVQSLDGGRSLSVCPMIVYGEPEIARVRFGSFEHVDDREIPIRNVVQEAVLLRNAEYRFGLSGTRPSIFSEEDAVSIARRLQNEPLIGEGVTACLPRGTLVPVGSGDNGAFHVAFSTDDGVSVDASSIIDGWRSNSHGAHFIEGQGWFRYPDEWLSEHVEALTRILQAREDKGEESIRYLLPDVIDISNALDIDPPQYFTRLRDGLEQHDALPSVPPPADARCQLRSYQQSGVNWMSFLLDHGLGALLADDMGLGKTVQALCVMRGRTLIVCPTSVLSSWREQIERFFPTRTVAMYHGANRILSEEADLTLTSYGIIRSEVASLKNQSWETIILDEAQLIRNPHSQIARAIHQLHAPHKICLSGTPIENSVHDLWSQFNFLNPGLLGSHAEFERSFVTPITGGDPITSKRLRTRVAPFILRRFKRDVAKELPPKTEVILECELSPEERSVYTSLLASTRKDVLSAIESQGAILSVLELLLRLRQACCHGGLIPGIAMDSSSKIDLLIEHLQQSKSHGHRALVFSQWTSLLDRIEQRLCSEGISFSRIDGSTSNRGSVVEEFQKTDGPDVMLLSLKAGGLGLTLTAADHVYILDPWWNPAVEDQAADRAYRIGQENPVIVHRLVAQNTVEERVLELQRRKRQVVEDTLGDKQPVTGPLSKEDLMFLLQGDE